MTDKWKRHVQYRRYVECPSGCGYMARETWEPDRGYPSLDTEPREPKAWGICTKCGHRWETEVNSATMVIEQGPALL